MSRLLAVLLGVLLLASSLPASTVAQESEPWSLEASTGRVALDFSSGSITADEVGFTIDNRTGLVLLVGEEMAGILALLGLRTGYSQIATWQMGDGPIIACPAPGLSLLCDDTLGVALVPNPGRAYLLARTPDAPSHTDLTVMVGDRSLAFDLAIVAVGMGLSVVAPDVRGVPTELLVDFALRVLPQAGVAADAFMAGDIDGATRALAAAGLAATEAIKDHALDIGLAIVGNLVPHIATVKLMLAAARAVPAVFTLVAALGNSERTTVRLSWEGVGEASRTTTAPSSTTETSCEPDSGFMTAAQVIASLPSTIPGGVMWSPEVFTGNELETDVETQGLAEFADADFVVTVGAGWDDRGRGGGTIGTFIRVAGMCEEEFLGRLSDLLRDAFGDDWQAAWRQVSVGGEMVNTTSLPEVEGQSAGVVLYAWTRGDVGVLVYEYPGEAEAFIVALEGASDSTEGASPPQPPDADSGSVDWVVNDVMTNPPAGGWRRTALALGVRNDTADWFYWWGEESLEQGSRTFPSALVIPEGREYEVDALSWNQEHQPFGLYGLSPWVYRGQGFPIPPRGVVCGWYYWENHPPWGHQEFGVLGSVPASTEVSGLALGDGSIVAVEPAGLDTCASNPAEHGMGHQLPLGSVGDGILAVSRYASGGAEPELIVLVRNDDALGGLDLCVRSWLVTDRGVYVAANERDVFAGCVAGILDSVGPGQSKTFGFTFQPVRPEPQREDGLGVAAARQLGTPDTAVIQVCTVSGDSNDCHEGGGEFFAVGIGG